jgi:hypothetical protein
MRKRTIDLLQDCVDVLESTDLEDVEALIGQLKAEIALYRAKVAVREAFENAETPVRPATKHLSKRKHSPKHASKPVSTVSTASLVA